MEETKKEFTPRPERAERPQRGRRRRKVCAFCVDKVAHVDYTCPSAARSCPAA